MVNQGVNSLGWPIVTEVVLKQRLYNPLLKNVSIEQFLLWSVKIFIKIVTKAAQCVLSSTNK